jgi:DNA-binding response OmpR family regulator
MVRPCFLVVDREFPSSISTRKLVIETAKFNVLTAYSGDEAVQTLKRFPAINGIVLDAGVQDVPCSDLVRRLREIQPGCPVVVVSAPGAVACQADFNLESFDPRKLLAILEKLRPEEAAEIERHNEQLNKEGI